MRVTARRQVSPSRAFDALYRKHAADIYRYALALLHRQADAEDAVQTTFLNAYRALEQGERPRNAGTWLRTIALNVCREQQRRAARRPDEVPLDEDPGDLVLDPETPAIGDVIRALSCLPFNQRAALVMREFEGRSMAEIASSLDVTPSAVETLLFRARRGLREQLGESLSCGQAEEAISAQLDGALPRDRRGPLRAHLRECDACASLARRLRAQRSAVRSLALIPVPASLRLFKFGSGASAGTGAAAVAGTSGGGSMLAGVTGSLLLKLGAATAIGATAVGVGYASLHQNNSRPAASPRHASTAEGASVRGGAEANAAGRETSSGSGSGKVAAGAAGQNAKTRSVSASRQDRTARTRRAALLRSGQAAAGQGRAVGRPLGTGAAASQGLALATGQSTTPAETGNGTAPGVADLGTSRAPTAGTIGHAYAGSHPKGTGATTTHTPGSTGQGGGGGNGGGGSGGNGTGSGGGGGGGGTQGATNATANGPTANSGHGGRGSSPQTPATTTTSTTPGASSSSSATSGSGSSRGTTDGTDGGTTTHAGGHG